jgi:hypothetical protein
VSGDSVWSADQILPTAARHWLAICDDLLAGVAIFGLSEMLMAVRVRDLRTLGGATSKREGGYAQASRALPFPFARNDARFNAPNAHDAYSVANESGFRASSNVDPHRGGKIFPKAQACCPLLTLLRFEFAKNSGSRTP